MKMPGVRFLRALVTPAIVLGLSLATYALATRWLVPAEFARFAVAMAMPERLDYVIGRDARPR